MATSLLLIPWWIPWVEKYISCSFSFILLKPFHILCFTIETIKNIIPNLRETPNSFTALAYHRKTSKPQTSSKQGCFASNQTQTFPYLKSFILNLNSIITKPQISPITFGTRHVPYPLKLHPIPLNYHKPISNLPKLLDHTSLSYPYIKVVSELMV